MSVENALAFIKHLEGDAVLRRRVEAISGAKILRQFCEIAAASGFVFNEEEYREAVVSEAGGELSEESLNQVLDELGLEKR